MKFHEDNIYYLEWFSSRDFVTETATYKVQRGITQKKKYIQELWFLRSAHRLMLVNRDPKGCFYGNANM